MSRNAQPRHAVSILFAVVFIDLVGFGILAPLIPFYVERLGARPEIITLLIAAHPLCQSLAGPFWGSMSDRLGRRPVLLVSMLGHGASYLVLAWADSLWMLLVARMLSGATSANLATAFAYVSDVTGPEQRAGAMGKLSSAFGLGFAVGPAIGGLLAGGDTMADANLVRPAIAAALFSFAAFAAIWIFLPETRPVAAHALPDRSLGEFGRIARRPVITAMLIMATIVLMFMSVRESIFPLWANHQHHLNARTLGIMLGWTGGMIALIQFFGMGWLTSRFGELALVKSAIVFLTIGWLGLTLAWSVPTLLVAMSIGSFGTAFFQTSMQSLLSKRSGATERGAVLGVYQSSSAMARFVGQAGAGTLYGQLGANAPFLLGSLAMVPAFFMAMRIGTRMSEAAVAAPVGGSPE